MTEFDLVCVVLIGAISGVICGCSCIVGFISGHKCGVRDATEEFNKHQG